MILPYRSGAHFAPGAVFLHGGDQIIPAWEREKSVPGADMQKNSGKSSVLERFWNGLAHFEEQCRAYNSLDTVELLMNLEDEIGMELELDQKLETVGDLDQFIQRKKAER